MEKRAIYITIPNIDIEGDNYFRMESCLKIGTVLNRIFNKLNRLGVYKRFGSIKISEGIPEKGYCVKVEEKEIYDVKDIADVIWRCNYLVKLDDEKGMI